MRPETEQAKTGAKRPVAIPPLPWTALTAKQQQALTSELARLLCQYVQSRAPRTMQEVDDERPAQNH